jgi:muconate cycloisomerase
MPLAEHEPPGGVPRIRAVEAIPLRLPFRRSFTMSDPHQPSRGEVEVVLVRITADNDLAGLGETQAWRRQGSGETLPRLVTTITDHFAPALAGRSVFDIAPIMAELGAQGAGSLFAQAAVGDALYDLAARCVNLPLYDFLGGKVRSRIPVGLAIGVSGGPSAVIEAAQSVYERGYRHIRIKIGSDLDLDHRTVSELRKHFADRAILRADANGSMNYGDALRLLTRLEPFDLDLVEQPLPGWDLAGMAALGQAVRIPLSADESLSTDHSLVAIARHGAARIIQTKSGKNGGIHAIRRLWTLADAFGIGIFPGNHPSTGINVAAVAHLAASWPGRILVGDFQTGVEDMIADDVLVRRVEVRDGHVIVPDGVGLGVELDDEKVRKFRIDT